MSQFTGTNVTQMVHKQNHQQPDLKTNICIRRPMSGNTLLYMYICMPHLIRITLGPCCSEGSNKLMNKNHCPEGETMFLITVLKGQISPLEALTFQ